MISHSLLENMRAVTVTISQSTLKLLETHLLLGV